MSIYGPTLETNQEENELISEENLPDCKMPMLAALHKGVR